MFSKYGPVKEARVALDVATGRSKGYAFITMENAEDAKDSLKGPFSCFNILTGFLLSLYLLRFEWT